MTWKMEVFWVRIFLLFQAIVKYAFVVLQLGAELVVEEVSEEFSCYDSEKSSANSDTKGLYVHNQRVLIHIK
jgi:hypothetical protein